MRVCTLAAFLGLVLVVGFAASQENTVRYNATVLQGSGEGCPPDELREAVRANISQDIRVVLQGYSWEWEVTVLVVVMVLDGPGLPTST